MLDYFSFYLLCEPGVPTSSIQPLCKGLFFIIKFAFQVIVFITGIDEIPENDNEVEDAVYIKQRSNDENRVLDVKEWEASVTSPLQYLVTTISSLLDFSGNFID